MSDRNKPKTITQAQYYQLIGLVAAAKRQHEILEAMADAAWQITGELDHDGTPDKTGHTMDIIWQSRELDDGLRIMNITVEQPGSGASDHG